MAQKLGVSDKTIYRMVNDNQIPFAVKIGGQWRFRVDAIDTWLASGMNSGAGSWKTDAAVNVYRALQQGAVLYRIHGKNRDECIRELFGALPYSTTLNRQSLLVSIFARESLASSSMQGIGNMGVSDEQPVYAERSMIIIAFLEKATDFKGMDKIATSVFFLVLPANRGEQAILENRLSRLLQETAFRDFIKKQPPRHEILELIREYEARIF
jgi:PTS system nitrogen regulatory IIA component